MLVVYHGQRYVESSAFLKVMQQLKFPFSLSNIGYLVPSIIRDFLYRRVALNRYQLFGTTSSFLLPSQENRSHFLEHAIHEA